MTARRAAAAQRLTVLYDGDCAFCSLTADILVTLDRHRRLELVPLQHAREHPSRPSLAAVARRYPLSESIHVVSPAGGVSAGGDATLQILEALPGGWLFRPWRILPGMVGLLDIGYRAVARRRGAISRLIQALGGPPATCDLDGHGRDRRYSLNDD